MTSQKQQHQQLATLTSLRVICQQTNSVASYCGRILISACCRNSYDEGAKIVAVIEQVKPIERFKVTSN